MRNKHNEPECEKKKFSDVLTPEQRHYCMSRIKGKNTKPELIVRSLLHLMGYRFRLHRIDLPSKPDIVLSKYKTVIFVHGCFWHRHNGCRFAYTPKNRADFWLKKLESNVNRDQKSIKELSDLGWNVITVWECELREPDQLSSRLAALLQEGKRRGEKRGEKEGPALES